MPTLQKLAVLVARHYPPNSMPEYRRAYQPGGTFFFTLVTHDRQPLFSDRANVERLRAAVREVRDMWPFESVAGVVLFDHLHFMWTLPPGDSEYSKRIGRMKVLFTRSLADTPWSDLTVSSTHAASRHRQGESGVWQRRFWEHVIRDADDYEHHFNYLHYNPVKHGLCGCPHDWTASSFAYWVERKVYDPSWCCRCASGTRIQFPYPDGLGLTFGE
jgi:putative transposase